MDELSPRREIKQGRRAGNVFQSLSTSILSEPSTTTVTQSQNVNSSSPKPARRQSGWSDSVDKKKGKNVCDDDEADDRLKSDSKVLSDTNIDDIPVIPDLEEIQKDGTTQQVSAPPSVQVTRVATYKELDHDFEKHAGLLTLDKDIDLKLLGCVLSSEADVFEEDKVWEWDRVFAEVSSELRNDWESIKVINDKSD
ncbi:intraflagellar transport protein 43 homolog isoform X2 [Hydra vulgaris]|uniref:Intraflagellar transport protein 43 homolog isoform X2 n=1 Tax=Hydra vulgaris TaxID=6087 RepID=A0ABM4C2F3_HYDVU